MVDHIIPLAHGGARLDPANLRAACSHCNASLGARVVRPTTWSAH
jgi:5-methylcytosine-specific restriction endonuclease McrA